MHILGIHSTQYSAFHKAHSLSSFMNYLTVNQKTLDRAFLYFIFLVKQSINCQRWPSQYENVHKWEQVYLQRMRSSTPIVISSTWGDRPVFHLTHLHSILCLQNWADGCRWLQGDLWLRAHRRVRSSRLCMWIFHQDWQQPSRTLYLYLSLKLGKDTASSWQSFVCF